MKKHQAVYADDHIIFYPAYVHGVIMKWFSGIFLCVCLALLFVFMIDFDWVMVAMSFLGMAIFAILWMNADRIMYTKIWVDHGGAKMENPQTKKVWQFLWCDVKEMKTTITRGIVNLTFVFHDTEKDTCTMTITSAVDHKALSQYLPMERMADKDRYTLDI